MFRSQVLICGGTGCTSSGSDEISKVFEQEVAKAVEGAEHERIVEHVVAGVDENGKPYAYETEEVEGEK